MNLTTPKASDVLTTLRGFELSVLARSTIPIACPVERERELSPQHIAYTSSCPILGFVRDLEASVSLLGFANHVCKMFEVL